MKKIGLAALFSLLLCSTPANAFSLADVYMFIVKTWRYTNEVRRYLGYVEKLKEQAEELLKQNEYMGPAIEKIPQMTALDGNVAETADEYNATKNFFEDIKETAAITPEFRDMVSFPTDVSKKTLNEGGRKDDDRTLEGVLFRAFADKDKAKEYVVKTFFAPADKELYEETAKEIEEKRLQLQKEVSSENYAYAQVVKTEGQEDFANRAKQVADENQPKEISLASLSEDAAKEQGVASEAKAWAVNTLALRNVIQETMVRVVLEQRLLEQEAVDALVIQPKVLVRDPAKERE